MGKKSNIGSSLAFLLAMLLTSKCSQGIGTSSQHQIPSQQIHESSAALVDDDYEENLDPSTMPYFDYGVPRNISTTVGQHAFILCRVYRIKDKSVSFIRKRDLHILTAGVFTYTSDQRFVVIHPEKSENWTLQIKYPQERDAGIYECQVNTSPKISLAFHLSVIESKARMVGGSDVYVKSGSSLRLTCEVEHGPHDIAQVFWYHGSNLVDPLVFGDSQSSDIRVITQRSEILRSQLTILKVKSNHSGNYSCSPTMSVPASVMVHVISGEHPSAMVHGKNKSSSSISQIRTLEFVLLFTFLRFIVFILNLSTMFCTDTDTTTDSNTNTTSSSTKMTKKVDGNLITTTDSISISTRLVRNCKSVRKSISFR